MSNLPNWFNQYAIQYFSGMLKEEMGKPNLKYLQIGAYTGDASKWLLENVLTHPTSSLIDVDTWGGSKEKSHDLIDWQQVEDTYDERMTKFGDKVTKIKSKSIDYLEVVQEDNFDFIYIDGDHRAGSVLMDGTLSWKPLKMNGLLVFDDWNWDLDSELLNAPLVGINAFLHAKYGKYKIIGGGSQVWVKKIKL